MYNVAKGRNGLFVWLMFGLVLSLVVMAAATPLEADVALDADVASSIAG